MAVTSAAQMQAIQPPTEAEETLLNHWLDRPDGGSAFLRDREEHIWSKRNDADFLSLFQRQLEMDAFTSLLQGVLLDLYHRLWGHRQKVRRP